ncbi:hypothetical protein EV667_3056 [Ancylobacter aquaticus]|uniref:DUF2946 domain-containing protein n=1 Tax=Ancylobacter aquaticus TaxID=100 RepID=A0A4R1I2M7_ANCAQ|nr:hypothetical protein [Ancylobacter aquaticus]TCK29038.1 hypothetical protein EV667_3056 [Ancylobacter aquaticus]
MSTIALTTEQARPAGAPLRRWALVLAVAYVLVLQALFGGIASGAHAAGGVTLDAFGQALCLSSHSDPAAPGEPARHTPDCCLTGCQAAPAAALPPPVAATVALPTAPLEASHLPPPPARLARTPERSPGHIRAPPRA